MTNDSCFAPNPNGKHLTLATCKIDIRKKAIVGDWVTGLCGTSLDCPKCSKKLIWIGKVHRRMTFTEYYNNPEFDYKKPRPDGDYNGDNVYWYDKNGDFHQDTNTNHHKNDENKKHDEKGKYVLIFEEFYYFGHNAQPLEDRFYRLFPYGASNGFCHPLDPNTVQSEFVEWVKKSFKPGKHGSCLHKNLQKDCKGGC